MPGKLVCASCFKEAARDNAADARRVKSYIKAAVKEGLRGVSRRPARPALSSASEGSDLEPSDRGGSDWDKGSYSSESEAEPESHTFEFALVPAFVEAVKVAMKWREEASPPKKQRKYFPDLKKLVPSFPLIPEIQEIVEDEWTKPDKKLNIHNRVSKLYPFSSKDAEL